MTNELGDTKKATKKGTVPKQMGGLLMALGVVIAIMTGSFGALPAIMFFAGLVTLIVGIAQRENDTN